MGVAGINPHHDYRTVLRHRRDDLREPLPPRPDPPFDVILVDGIGSRLVDPSLRWTAPR